MLDKNSLRLTDNDYIINDEQAAEVLKKIKNSLAKSNEWKVSLFLPRFHVPLLKVIYTKSNLKCKYEVI